MAESALAPVAPGGGKTVEFCMLSNLRPESVVQALDSGACEHGQQAPLR